MIERAVLRLQSPGQADGLTLEQIAALASTAG